MISIASIAIRASKVLSLFYVNTHLFLETLKITRSFLSGSSVLLMLTDMDFEPGDLDIYAPSSQDETILALAKNRLRFKERKFASDSYDHNTTIKKIYHLEKAGKRMNIMIIRGEDPTIALFQFHSTIVMNYLSAFEIYCAYPSLTLAKLSVVNVPVLLRESQRFSGRDRLFTCFDKYFRRGVTLKNDVTQFNGHTHHVCHSDAECPHTIRSTMDNKGMRITLFPPTDVDRLFAAQNQYMVVWALGGPMCGAHTTFFKDFAVSMKACELTVSHNWKQVEFTDHD
jgi:hypothetical protein